ncbi:PQQ-dependent sugar dehydrogenase [Nocardia transvalensis]|uniref:PQQ-dependent sugar dehydrogenase n=1 Tax=Nocardia transvalensis TaxID=37333 RepID=UPI001895E7CC|nr:PQQ-dependent sugar dehydrogenase [Nocardia transvalensis]MBF6329213.1 PQQ-dependent sugar dehydrogenase [Nocardia transvalensis]
MRLVVAGRVASVLAVTAGLVVGCASFDDSASQPFSPAPTVRPEGMGPSSPKPPTTKKRPPGPCEDPDPAVVASCLEDPTGLVAMPDGRTGLVAERGTGRIFLIDTQDPGPWPYYLKQIAQVDVDSAGDGGLNDIAISPTYNEDRLLYAYITTGGDNRVVRISPDGAVKPILTGIPKGSTGNRGAIQFDAPDRMLVLTGDAGDPAAAGNPGSLAGKLLRVKSPTSGGNAAPDVLVSGIGTAGGLCLGDQGNVWISDRTAVADRLQRVGPDGVVSTAWSWPDHPGAAGCVAGTDTVAIAMTNAKAIAMATVDKNTLAITTAPALLNQDKWGRLNGAAPGPNGTIWVDTVNKVGGQPTPTDDRVIVIAPSKGGGGVD